MKSIYYFFIILFFITACTQPEQKSESTEEKPGKEFTHPTLILMHSPTGIRVEYNLDEQSLNLWISPQAGKDNDYWIRNFSCRDDHTLLFDRISLPNLKLEDFEKCDYDPFHSVVHFKDQKLHIAALFDQPAVIVWTEKPEIVDVKSNKQDKVVQRDDHLFYIKHPDRGLDFTFFAALGKGEGKFQHQLQIDRGRSTYARAHLSPDQPLYFVGELTKENVPGMVENLLQKQPKEWLGQTNEKVDEIVQYGRVVFKDDPELQELVDFNRRIWVSVQDHSGALRASVKSIYYLIWVREGGLACPFIGYTGWMYPLEKWTEFQMENPTEIYDEGPGGRFFGQLVNKKITKWQEDGAFYAIWSAFTHWTQTGDSRFITGANLVLLEESMDWLERYCYDEGRELFYRRYYCETPLKQSRDYGWDNAVGFPVGWQPAPYKGVDIIKSYDIYENMLNYAAYQMLASMNVENNNMQKANLYLEKAKTLEIGISSMFNNDSLPLYGLLIDDQGNEVIGDPYGMDETDYEWALTCPPFYPDYKNILHARELLLEDLMEEPDGYFLAAYFSILGEADIEFCNQDSIMKALKYTAQFNHAPWKYLPLGNSMVEMSGPPPKNAAHYIRPQMFTIGAWQGAMAGLGIERAPFGIAVRPAKYITGIENYQYKNKLINFSFHGEGEIASVEINGVKLQNTWQIPENMINMEKNTVSVKLKPGAEVKNVLVSSTMELLNAERSERTVFTVVARGRNNLIFKNLNKKLEIRDNQGKSVDFQETTFKAYTVIDFESIGNLTITLE